MICLEYLCLKMQSFFELPDMQLKPTLLYAYTHSIEGELKEIKISDGCNNFFYTIIRLINLPSMEFDFEVSDDMVSCNLSCSPSDYCKGGKCDINGCYKKDRKECLKTRIEKAIKDAGLLAVNPYGEEKPNYGNLGDFFDAIENENMRQNYLLDRIKEWQDAEQKVIKDKNLLIIKKLKTKI